MGKSFLAAILFCAVMVSKGLTQPSVQTSISAYSHHPPSADKESWQRLNLMQAATYFRVVREGEVDFDSCLLRASKWLGLSRLLILAEGIDDPALLTQSQWVDTRDPAMGMRNLSQATGKKKVQVLLLLGAYYAFQPRSNYRGDSVEYFLSRAISEAGGLQEKRLERQARCLWGKMYFEINQYNKGDSVFAQLIRECEAAGDKITAARAYEYRAFYPDYNPVTTENRIAWFNKAAQLYRELDNTEREISAIMDAGYLSVPAFQLQQAHEAFLQSLRLAESINFPYVHYITDAIAMVTIFQGKFGEPLKYALQTIRTAEVTRDSIGWAYFYDRLSAIYHMEGGARKEETLKWALKSSDQFIKNRDPGLYSNLYNVTSMLLATNRCQGALEFVRTTAEAVAPRVPQDHINYQLSMANAYLCAKQYELAEESALTADSILQRTSILRGPQQRSIINLVLATVYYYEKKFDRSKFFFELYLSGHPSTRYLTNDIATYSHLIKIDSAAGDATSALKRYRQYFQLLDSNFKISRIRQAEELQVMYQIDEKENQIALLNQEAQLKQANLREATVLRNVTIGGIIGALIIAALLYRQNRQRKKTNNLITQKNAQLQHFLTEKEWLLKEIHHRVKNNLQIVMSLLNTQSAYIDNATALSAINDSQHRVHAMSLIHQKLYSTDNVSSIDMPSYIRELFTYLADSYNIIHRISFEYNIEPLEMDVSQAVPLGLILNEAITNSIKYAFPGDRDGIISISLRSTSRAQYLLVIADNGIGIPPDINSKKQGSLGMKLMAGLSEDLDGNFSIESGKGTTIKIWFEHDPEVHRSQTSTPSFALSN